MKGDGAMTHAQKMIETNPSGTAIDVAALVECIEACFDCPQASQCLQQRPVGDGGA